MGSNAPKSEELLAELEDKVKDAIIVGQSGDYVLDEILLIIINSIQTGRQLYSNPLKEPAFYQKYLRRWVDEGLEELAKINKLQKSGENG